MMQYFGKTVAVYLPQYKRFFPAVVMRVESLYVVDVSLLAGPVGLEMKSLTHEHAAAPQEHPFWCEASMVDELHVDQRR